VGAPSCWARLPKGTRNEFPPSVKKGKLRGSDGSQTSDTYDSPDGIIVHLTRECGGNVHDFHLVDVTCGLFEKETQGANPHSGTYNNKDWAAAKNAGIWILIHFLCQLIAAIQTMFRTGGTIGRGMISWTGGLCQLTTQSARIGIVRAVTI
jgi:hypothetical protein